MEENINKWCCARTPLRYGSKVCAKHPVGNMDLCKEHASELWPHLLIEGTLYLGTGLDEEGFPGDNPFK